MIGKRKSLLSDQITPVDKETKKLNFDLDELVDFSNRSKKFQKERDFV